VTRVAELELRSWSRRESDIFGVAGDRIFLGGVQLNCFLHRTLNLGKSIRACWNGAIFFETFTDTENSYCAPRFPLIVSCYRIVDSQTSFTLRSRSRKIWKPGVGHFTSDAATLHVRVHMETFWVFKFRNVVLHANSAKFNKILLQPLGKRARWMCD